MIIAHEVNLGSWLNLKSGPLKRSMPMHVEHVSLGVRESVSHEK